MYIASPSLPQIPCVVFLVYSCPHPQPLATTDLFSVPTVLPFPKRHENGILHQQSVESELFHLTVCLLRFSNFVACIGGSFLCLLINIPYYIYIYTIIRLSIAQLKEHLGCFQFGDYKQENCHKYTLTESCVNINFYFSWAMPKSGMTGLHGKNMFNFIRKCQIASNVVVPFCIPISNVKISSCSTLFVSTWYCQVF